MLQKCENFCRAVVRLSEALAEYAGTRAPLSDPGRRDPAL